MILENIQLQEIVFHHMNLSVINHLQLHGHVMSLVLDIVIVSNNLTTVDFHHVENSRTLRNNEEIVYVFIILPPEIKVTLLFQDQTLERNSD